MNDVDVTTYARPWDKDRYPVVVGIGMLTEQLAAFEARATDQRNIVMLGFDLSGFGEITVQVGCTSAEVGRWLKHHWAA